MTQAAKFDEQTHWDHDPGGPRFAGEGWAANRLALDMAGASVLPLAGAQ